MPMRKPATQGRERQARNAVVLWGSLTLGGIGILSAFALWHLARRGRLLRDRLGPPRPSDLSGHDADADDPTSSAT
jgi:hypothetical protein